MGREFTVRMEDVERSPVVGGHVVDANGIKVDAWNRVLIGANGEGQWVHVFEVPPGHVIEPHYHDCDQFQIVIAGSATMAGEPMNVGTVHFTEKHTPYGPIVAGPKGVTMMVVRPYMDRPASVVPTRDVIQKVKRAQRREGAPT